MPRQDVPYGGAICRLKERIAEIFDKLGEKLHTINGVPGDGDGNVKIVSGSSAVVISNDPTQNEIAVSLDSSQLPAASVSSVNGQTGAVALDAGDIPTVGGDVQADLQDLANDISGNTAAINAEVLARQGADSALQTNINTVTASLPSQVVAAVAADPTIALLVSADSDNVKLTGNQSIGGIKTVSTEATGTYSQQIANSNKVKAELDNYSYMLRTVNNQTALGTKTFENRIQGYTLGYYLNFINNALAPQWVKVISWITTSQYHNLEFQLIGGRNNGSYTNCKFCVIELKTGSKILATHNKATSAVIKPVLKLSYDSSTNEYIIWAKPNTVQIQSLFYLGNTYYGTPQDTKYNYTIEDPSVGYPEPVTGGTLYVFNLEDLV